MVLCTVSKWRVVVGAKWHAQLGCEHWLLDGTPWPKTVGFCDLLGTSYAPDSEILSVNDITPNLTQFLSTFMWREIKFVLLRTKEDAGTWDILIEWP